MNLNEKKKENLMNLNKNKKKIIRIFNVKYKFDIIII